SYLILLSPGSYGSGPELCEASPPGIVHRYRRAPRWSPTPARRRTALIGMAGERPCVLSDCPARPEIRRGRRSYVTGGLRMSYKARVRRARSSPRLSRSLVAHALRPE